MTGLFAGAAVDHDVPLAPLTTLRVGPVADRLITCTSTEQVVAALTALPDPLVLGGGSNVVLDDTAAGLTAVLLRNRHITVVGNRVRAQAGALWDDVVAASVAAGLGGLEALSGIPGSAGATPVQNVGAYGAEVADTAVRVRLLDRRTGHTAWADAATLGFGYRTSVLKHPTAAGPTPVVLEVEFALDGAGRSAPVRYGELAAALGVAPGERADPAQVRAAVLALRTGKAMVVDPDPTHPDYDTWSVGSFFTNPVVSEATFAELQARHDGPVPNYPASAGVKLAAGWLVERAGFGRGFPGPGAPARLSTRHALALTNRGAATTADIVALARQVRDGVRAAFGIELVPEPVLLGITL